MVFLRGKIMKSIWKTIIKITIAIIVVSSLMMNLFTHIMPVVRYYGDSMSPTLKDKQILFVNKLAEVKSGDIVAFYYNNNILIRRVVAVENQQVTVDIFGKVSVNGTELAEEYVMNQTLGQCNLDFPYTVPPNAYFVMGDNRETSMDSRLKEIGAVTEERMIGKIMFQ